MKGFPKTMKDKSHKILKEYFHYLIILVNYLLMSRVANVDKLNILIIIPIPNEFMFFFI